MEAAQEVIQTPKSPKVAGEFVEYLQRRGLYSNSKGIELKYL